MVSPQPSISAEASIAIEQERAFDRATAWLAMYVPSIGTSVVMHAALVLLAAFLIPFAVERPPEFAGVRGSFEPPQKTYEAEGRKPYRPAASRDFLKPEPERFFKRSPLKVRGIGENPLAKHVAIFGSGPDRVGGGPPGFSAVGGRVLFPPPSGRREPGRIVYLVDRSGSMTDSIMYVKYELKRSIGELDEGSAFHVIFYSSGPPVEMPTRRLAPATERNKEMAFAFIDRIVTVGETDPSLAFERAFAVGPEVIYFLTDGEFDKAVVDQVRRLNVGREVAVHTIQFLYRIGEAERLLRQIADQNNGGYTFVSEADLARIRM